MQKPLCEWEIQSARARVAYKYILNRKLKGKAVRYATGEVYRLPWYRGKFPDTVERTERNSRPLIVTRAVIKMLEIQRCCRDKMRLFLCFNVQ